MPQGERGAYAPAGEPVAVSRLGGMFGFRPSQDPGLDPAAKAQPAPPPLGRGPGGPHGAPGGSVAMQTSASSPVLPVGRGGSPTTWPLDAGSRSPVATVPWRAGSPMHCGSPPQAMNMFDALDRNHDGVLTRAEYQQALLSFQAPAPAPLPMQLQPTYSVAPPIVIPPMTAPPVYRVQAPIEERVDVMMMMNPSKERTQSRTRSVERSTESWDDRSLRHELMSELRQMEQQLRQDIDRRFAADKKAADREQENRHSLLKELVEEQGHQLSRVTHDKSAQEYAHSSIKSRMEALESSWSKRLQALEAELHEVVCLVGGDRLEDHIRRHLNQDKAARDRTGALAHSTLHSAHASLEEARVRERELEAKLHATHSRMDQLHANLSKSQQPVIVQAPVRELRASVEDRLGRLEQAVAAGASGPGAGVSPLFAATELQMSQVKDRVQYLENLIGDSAEKHRRELEAAHAKINETQHRHRQELEATHQQLQAAHGRLDQLHQHVSTSTQNAADQNMVASLGQTLEQRIEKVERLLQAQPAGRLEDKLKSVEVKVSAIENAVMDTHSTSKDTKSVMTSHHAAHATLKERVDYIEQLLGASADKHDKHSTGVQELRGKLEQTVGRLAALERHAKEVEDYHRSCAIFTPEEKAALDGHLKLLGSSHEKRSKDIEALKQAHHKHASDLEALHGAHQSTAQEAATAHAKLEQLHGRVSGCEVLGRKHVDGHTTLKGQTEELAAKHATLAERVEYLERLMGDSADRHARELEALRSAHANHAKELQGTKSAQAQHASVGERLDRLEAYWHDAGEKQAKATSTALARLDDLQRRLLPIEARAAAPAAVSPSTPAATSSAAVEASLASLRQRLEHLEATFLDHSAAHRSQLDDLRAGHAVLASQHKDRLASSHLAGAASGGAGAAHAEAAAAHAEAAASTAAAAHAKADLHDKELQSLKDRHAKHEKDTKAMQATHHATLTERVAQLEKLLHDTAAKHAAEVAAVGGRADQLHGRLATCESQTGALGELRRGHTALAGQKAALQDNHAVLKDRLGALEHAHTEQAERHAGEVNALKAAHRKLTTDTQAHQTKVAGQLAEHGRSTESHHATVQDRLEYLERSVGDSADKHAKALEVHKTAHGKLADAHRAQQEHHASLEQRLEFLEVTVGMSADRHPLMLEARSAASSPGSHFRGLLSTASATAPLGGGQGASGSLAARLELLEGLLGAGEREARLGASRAPLLRRVDGLEHTVGELRRAQEHIVEGVEHKLKAVKEAWTRGL